jgi:hypothetical protein
MLGAVREVLEVLMVEIVDLEWHAEVIRVDHFFHILDRNFDLIPGSA